MVEMWQEAATKLCDMCRVYKYTLQQRYNVDTYHALYQ